MRKPKNRKERINFLTKKLGTFFVQGMVGFTDKEVKLFVDRYYDILKNKEDYIEPESKCIRCNMPVLYHYECGCGFDRAVFDEQTWKEDIEGNDDRISGDEEFIKNGYKISKN